MEMIDWKGLRRNACWCCRIVRKSRASSSRRPRAFKSSTRLESLGPTVMAGRGVFKTGMSGLNGGRGCGMVGS